MRELISGKEALIALANGDDVEFFYDAHECWMDVKHHETSIFFRDYKFRLKPKTILLNGIEVPAPFEPKDGERYFYLWDCKGGYGATTFKKDIDPIVIGAWRTEDEIKQVVAELRKIFVINNQ